MTQMQNMTCVQKKTLLGLPLYEKYRNDDKLMRLFACGLWREDVNFSSYGESRRQVYFCGIPLWGRCIENHILSWHLGRNTQVSELNIPDVLERDMNRLFGSHPATSSEQRRQVFVLWANSGEIAILFSIFMPRLLAKMELSATDVVFLCTKQYHADMAALFFPEVKSVVAKPKILRHVTRNLETRTWDVNVFFTGAYFCEFERQAKRSNAPLDCIEWMARHLELSPVPATLTPELNKRLDDFEEAADRKLKHRTEWSKTILISPTSFSCASLSAEDTAAIHNMAIERGFDVYVNHAPGSGVLSFPELLSKARHAVGIVGLRSGLIDFLNITSVPMLVLYRGFSDRGFNTPACSVDKVRVMFTLSKGVPFDKVTEINADPVVNLHSMQTWFDNLAKKTFSRDK